MRTYGRVYNSDGTYKWVEVSTAPNGDNTEVYLTTLCQVLSLFLNESPFFANYGIPALQAVKQQIPPDFYVTVTQQQFSQYFANLVIARTSSNPPTYFVRVLTFTGAVLTREVAT